MYNSCVKNRAGFSTLKEISRIWGNPDRFREFSGNEIIPGNFMKFIKI